jgi:hypothetical protein
MVGLYLLPSAPIASKEVIQTNVHLSESETIEAIAIEDDEITQVTKK